MSDTEAAVAGALRAHERAQPATAAGSAIALSGGVDSMVLLDAAARWLPPPQVAIHVDHGLHPESATWTRFCASAAAARGIPFHSTRATIDPNDSRGLEAAARAARYAALAYAIDPGAVLVTAHHADDQAETLLLQLLRGSGPRGLAGMGAWQRWAGGWLARPFLDLTRATLQAYAEARDLPWIEDPSNADRGRDRNRLRHDILPALQTRWPQAARTLGRAAGIQAEAAALLQDLAAIDREACRADRPESLRIAPLQALPARRQRNVLRAWFAEQGLALPSQGVLERIRTEGLAAAPDRAPQVNWPGGSIHRFRGQLYAFRAPPLRPRGPWPRPWDPAAGPLALPETRQWLIAEPVTGTGLRRPPPGTALWVAYRAGGERCRGTANGPKRSLKQWLYEAGVPPWERDRLPLIRVQDGEAPIAAIGDRWICGGFQAEPGQAGWRFSLRPA